MQTLRSVKEGKDVLQALELHFAVCGEGHGQVLVEYHIGGGIQQVGVP